MRKNALYAVVTGDIVGSSKLTTSQRRCLLLVLKSSFTTIKNLLPDGIRAPFEIHRGDSFQGVLSRPDAALRVAIAIRTSLRHGFETKQRRHALDARIAVGIGRIDFLPASRGSEGDGEAFRRSGQTLDEMKGDQRLLIRTPWQEVDGELDAACALLDALISRLSGEQAQAILGRIRGLTQEKAAREFGVSQPAVRQRLKSAGGWAIEALCRRYEQVICEKRSLRAYNKW